jgi:hypothetical protein
VAVVDSARLERPATPIALVAIVPIDAAAYITSMAAIATPRINPRLTFVPKASSEVINCGDRAL